MPNYDFQSLSSFDFELLVRDLLQKELAIRLESFAPGRDRGIDFRFRALQGDLVVQCKHYADFDALFRVLKRDEVAKVRRLNPSRYILAVSAPLTPDRKEKLMVLLRPHCLEPADIYGREDLNNLLGRYEAVERLHIKLWLTSETVLTRFLQGGIWGDADLALQRIRQRTRRYVSNPSLQRARKILDKHHYCIIAGIPGIGKTTLAEILLIEFVQRHDFQAVRIANELAEIKGVKSPNQRQIFYFDDFLGKTTLDKLQRNEDQRLMEFLEEVAGNKNWRFILTTREYILNAARNRYEALAHPPVDLAPCIVDLSDYTHPIRAQILYNHLFFSDISDEHKKNVLEDRHYNTILRHRNYNPRIIEHMTMEHIASHIPPGQFFDNFIRNLENPTRVWDHAFRHQLRDSAQHLLLVLASMPDEVVLADLERAFYNFYQFRRMKIGFSTTSRDFEDALKELDGNFIRTELVGDDRIVAFHNPSVSDFLEQYLANSLGDLIDLVESATFFEQLAELWDDEDAKASDEYSGVFLQALSRLLSSPDCRIVRYGNGREILGIHHSHGSEEERIEFSLGVTDQLEAAPDAIALAKRLHHRLAENIKVGRADKDDLISLLVSRKTDRTKAAKPIFDAAKGYITGARDEFEDFASIGKFVKSFPGAIAPEELAVICAECVEACEQYADVWERDPSVLRGIAEDIRSVGSNLSLDIDELSDDLVQRADELEQEKPDRADPSDGDWRDNEDHIDTENTDAMFDNLLQEIEERAR